MNNTKVGNNNISRIPELGVIFRLINYAPWFLCTFLKINNSSEIQVAFKMYERMCEKVEKGKTGSGRERESQPADDSKLRIRHVCRQLIIL